MIRHLLVSMRIPHYRLSDECLRAKQCTEWEDSQMQNLYFKFLARTLGIKDLCCFLLFFFFTFFYEETSVEKVYCLQIREKQNQNQTDFPVYQDHCCSFLFDLHQVQPYFLPEDNAWGAKPELQMITVPLFKPNPRYFNTLKQLLLFPAPVSVFFLF